jgi:hypothetical protein
MGRLTARVIAATLATSTERGHMHRPTRAFIAGLLIATLTVVGCGGAAGTLSDPRDILDAGVRSMSELETVHLEAELVGSIPFDLGAGDGGEAIDLSGASLEADVDIEAAAAQMTIALPMLLGLEAEMIVVDDASYTRVSFLSDKYQRSAMTDEEGPAGALQDPGKTLEDIISAIDDLETPPERLDDERCGEEDCYHVRVSLAGADLDELSKTAPGLGSTGTLDVWVRKSDQRIARLDLRGSDDPEALSVTVTLSDYDKPLDITAPPPELIEGG